jgi:predicted dehydrogenase
MIVKSDNSLIHWPQYIIVIGGGRWARVLIESICNLTPIFVRVSVHSPKNHIAMAEWILSSGLDCRVEVFHYLPKSITEKLCVVIVANAAKDHEKAIEWALLRHLPVLVEKPITTSFFATQRLVNLAKTQEAYLASAHVFLFASYIEKFSKLVSKEKNITSVRVVWTDPQSEHRYGEQKKYDPALPIFADCLPHILSILGSFIDSQEIKSKSLLCFKGGAHLKLNLVFDLIPCEIEMARNHDFRQRIIEVNTEKRKLILDFSYEPGVISCDIGELDESIDGWGLVPSPVASMLLAFFQAAARINFDYRLDNLIGLRANQVIDDVIILYRDSLSKLLNHELKKCLNDINSDLLYAFSEILQINDPDSLVPLGQRINYLHERLKKFVLMSNEVRINDINEALNLIINEGKNTTYLQ